MKKGGGRMKRLLIAALFALAAANTTTAYAAQIQVAESRFIVGFKDGVSANDRRLIVEKLGGRVLREWDLLNAIVVESQIFAGSFFKGQLAANPQVKRIENDFTTNWFVGESVLLDFKTLRQNFEGQIRRSPAKQEAGKEPEPVETQWGILRVNAPAAWPSNKGADVKVAIVDTGIDPNHPDLSENVAGGYNAIDKGQPWTDDHFHGTHVAGIVAANLNGKGVVGVAPKAKLYGVKVLTKDGSGSLVSIIDGMLWCVQNGMQVANMSLGAPQGNFFFEQAVQTMVQSGVTLVAAAGNDSGAVNFPAAYEAAIAVSALDENDKIAGFSSRGPEVDFIAPGVKVPSSVTGGGIAAYSGTSMATPHVSGLAALAVAQGAATPEAVRAALSRSAAKLPDLAGNEQGHGLINAAGLR